MHLQLSAIGGARVLQIDFADKSIWPQLSHKCSLPLQTFVKAWFALKKSLNSSVVL